jgi:hypothetical protein
MNIFETIYRWFVSFFGGDMADYLSGFICQVADSEGKIIVEEGFFGNNQYSTYGLIALLSALAVMLVYYYGINHPRFNRWWSWLVMLFIVGAANFGVAVGMLWNEWYTVGTAECLIAGGNGGIDGNSCLGFGFAHSIIAILFFIIFSLAFKWWSTNCKYSPFIKF